MKTIALFVGIVLLADALPAQPHLTDRVDQEFRLGEKVASCLVVQCQIFRGYLTTDLPKPGTPIFVRVQEWLFGDPAQDEIVPLSWEDNLNSGDRAGTSSPAWKSVRIEQNATVTVVVSHEQGLFVRPREVVFVTTGEHETDVVRMLATYARKMQQSPPSISQMVSEPTEPAMAAYLFTHVMLSRSFTGRDLRAEVLSQLLAHPSVPPDRWDVVARWLVMGYYALSATTRERITRRLAEVGQYPNDAAAGAAFHGLAKIAAVDAVAMRTTISPMALTKLKSRYAALLKKGIISRLPPLDSGLSVTRR